MEKSLKVLQELILAELRSISPEMFKVAPLGLATSAVCRAFNDYFEYQKCSESPDGYHLFDNKYNFCPYCGINKEVGILLK